MSKKAKLQYFRSKNLLPFQAEFAATFLENKDTKYWELVSPLGTGKTRLVKALIECEFEDALDKRVLILAPAPILFQWHFERISVRSTENLDIAPRIIDRKIYLELESQIPVGDNPWPIPAIVIMSVDLAKRDDMIVNLCKANWDLIIFDESHLLRGKSKELFDQLINSGAARRALLLTSITPQFSNSLVKRVKIEMEKIVDWHGRQIYSPLERKIKTIYYRRTKKEREFLNELQKFAGMFSDKWWYGKQLEISTLWVASSTFYTIEKLLHRLQDVWGHIRNKIVHGILYTDEDLKSVQQQIDMFTNLPSEADILLKGISIKPEDILAFYQKLELLLDKIEEIPTDSKLDILIAHLKERSQNIDKTYICIWSSFIDTVRYLSSSLQDLGVPVYSLTNTMEAIERKDKIEGFRKVGGVLNATDIALEGISLEYVDECINFDLPLNKLEFEQRWGRFLRMGRKGGFRMYILKDKSQSLPWEDNLSKNLGK